MFGPLITAGYISATRHGWETRFRFLVRYNAPFIVKIRQWTTYIQKTTDIMETWMGVQVGYPKWGFTEPTENKFVYTTRVAARREKAWRTDVPTDGWTNRRTYPLKQLWLTTNKAHWVKSSKKWISCFELFLLQRDHVINVITWLPGARAGRCLH